MISGTRERATGQSTREAPPVNKEGKTSGANFTNMRIERLVLFAQRKSTEKLLKFSTGRIKPQWAYKCEEQSYKG